MLVRNIFTIAFALFSPYLTYGMDQQGQKRPLPPLVNINKNMPLKKQKLENEIQIFTKDEPQIFSNIKKNIFDFNATAIGQLLSTDEASELNKEHILSLSSESKKLKENIKQIRAAGSLIASQTSSQEIKDKFSFSFDIESENIKKTINYLDAFKFFPQFKFPHVIFTPIPYKHNISPLSSPDKYLENLINNEQEKISICCFHLDLMNIVNALIKQKNKGISVEVVTNQKQGNQPTASQALIELAKNKIPILAPQNDKFEENHHKFFIFERNILDKSLVWNGSYNPTSHANKRSWDDITIFDNEHVAEQFKNRFQEIKNRSKAINFNQPAYNQNK